MNDETKGENCYKELIEKIKELEKEKSLRIKTQVELCSALEKLEKAMKALDDCLKYISIYGSGWMEERVERFIKEIGG